MSNMLRHIPTGDLYIATAALMARGDMEMVEPDPVVAAPEVVAPAEEPKPKRKAKAKEQFLATNPFVAPDPVADGVDWDAE